MIVAFPGQPTYFFLIICLVNSASLGNSTNPESLSTFESTNKAPDRIVCAFHEDVAFKWTLVSKVLYGLIFEHIG